ncbi:MAG: hypothetical protein ABIE84_00120 [bacterium]
MSFIRTSKLLTQYGVKGLQQAAFLLRYGTLTGKVAKHISPREIADRGTNIWQAKLLHGELARLGLTGRSYLHEAIDGFGRFFSIIQDNFDNLSTGPEFVAANGQVPENLAPREGEKPMISLQANQSDRGSNDADASRKAYFGARILDNAKELNLGPYLKRWMPESAYKIQLEAQEKGFRNEGTYVLKRAFRGKNMAAILTGLSAAFISTWLLAGSAMALVSLAPAAFITIVSLIITQCVVEGVNPRVTTEGFEENVRDATKQLGQNNTVDFIIKLAQRQPKGWRKTLQHLRRVMMLGNPLEFISLCEQLGAAAGGVAKQELAKLDLLLNLDSSTGEKSFTDRLGVMLQSKAKKPSGSHLQESFARQLAEQPVEEIMTALGVMLTTDLAGMGKYAEYVVNHLKIEHWEKFVELAQLPEIGIVNGAAEIEASEQVGLSSLKRVLIAVQKNDRGPAKSDIFSAYVSRLQGKEPAEIARILQTMLSYNLPKMEGHVVFALRSLRGEDLGLFDRACTAIEAKELETGSHEVDRDAAANDAESTSSVRRRAAERATTVLLNT